MRSTDCFYDVVIYCFCTVCTESFWLIHSTTILFTFSEKIWWTLVH